MSNISSQSIELTGTSGKIPAIMMTPKDTSGILAVILPGSGYSYRQPLLHFLIQGLLARGFRVLAFNKMYGEDPHWNSLPSESEARKVISNDALAIFQELKIKYQMDVHTIIGKSFGAYAAACAIDAGILNPRQIVWLTPALGSQWHVMRNCGIRGLGILGTSDYYYKDAVSNLPDDHIVIENADHGMEIANKPLESIQVLQKITQATLDWLLD